MSSKHSVNVIVRARDQASKKLGLIGNNALNMGKMFRRAAAGIAIYFSARAIKNFAIESVNAYADEETANRKLQSALLATGHAHGFSLGQLKNYANELQSLTTFEDEAVKSNMAILSTFKNIKGDNFKEATLAAMDMSILLETDLKSSILQVGKALNDPIRGITAMTRSGVSFSEQQKKQIKNFAKTNQLAKAQRIILDELAGEFGGQSKAAATTYTGKVKQMRMALDDVKEAIGKALMPAFASSAVKIKTWAENNQERIGQWAEKTMSYVKLAKDVFGSFGKFMKNDFKSAVSYAFDSFLVLIKTAFESAVELAIAGGKGIWRGVKTGLLGGGEQAANRSAVKRLEDKEGIKLKGQDAAYRSIPWKVKDKDRKQWVKDNYTQIDTGLVGDRFVRKGSPVLAKLQKLQAEEKGKHQKQQVDSVLGNTLSTIGDKWKSAAQLIAKSVPPAMTGSVDKAFANHKSRLLAIGKPKGNETGGGVIPHLPGGTVGGSFAGMQGDKQKLTAKESRFLTHRTGPKKADAVAKNTAKTVALLEKMIPLLEEKFLFGRSANTAGQIKISLGGRI